MKEKNKNNDELNQKVEQLKQEFETLTQAQKELLLYRKIAQIVEKEHNWKDFDNFLFYNPVKNDELTCLIEAADIGKLKPLVAYAMSDYKLTYQEVNQESLIRYNHVLENYKKLAQEFKLNSSLDLSHLLTYMLWNGYFSVSKEHSYQLQDRKLLPGMYSFDVINGKGVCLAYAELLHNYLEVCDKNSALLICKVPTKKKAISCDYSPEIERNISSNAKGKVISGFVTFLLRGLINKIGNHAITLIEENEKIYAYDPTNLYALNIKNAVEASLINGKGEYKLNPLTTLMIDCNADPHHIYEKLLTNDIKPALSRKEFIFSFENLMELINSNIGLLDDAYDNIHSDLEHIAKQTEDINNFYKLLKRK